MKSLIIRLLRLLRLRRTRPDTFLIPAYAGLGNFIMATPMILELKRRVPGARIYLLTWPWYGTDQIFDAPVVASGRRRHSDSESSQSPVSGTFLLDPAAPVWRKVWFFLRLRSWRFRTAFIPFDACPPFVWLGFVVAGIPCIAAHSHESWDSKGVWVGRVPDVGEPINIVAHESDIHLDLLDAFCRKAGVAIPPERDYRTHMVADGPEALEKYGLVAGGYIVVQISAANARFRSPKLWARENWAELIRRFESSGETVVLPGDDNEAALVDEFAAREGFTKVVNIAGKTSVRDVSTVIKHAKLLVVHDSGLMHIGNAHGTPLLALYGPTDWNFTMPKAATSRILKKALPCQPCMARMAKTEQEALRDCPIAVQCMTDITVDEVHQACREILG